MSSAKLLSGLHRVSRQTATFVTATTGATGVHTVFNVTGVVRISHAICRCTTSLTSGGAATIESGTANNTAALFAQATATDIDATDFWRDGSPELEVGSTQIDFNANANITITIQSSAISAGVLEFVFFWYPLSRDGFLAAPTFA